mmetsp:Transcript_108586/g.350433  ORF Transcript_108586/g.350433 Transcript_108586/m.350433 type:complete len:204 (-) Transcript_108586:63-674(-)
MDMLQLWAGGRQQILQQMRRPVGGGRRRGGSAADSVGVACGGSAADSVGIASEGQGRGSVFGEKTGIRDVVEGPEEWRGRKVDGHRARGRGSCRGWPGRAGGRSKRSRAIGHSGRGRGTGRGAEGGGGVAGGGGGAEAEGRKSGRSLGGDEAGIDVADAGHEEWRGCKACGRPGSLAGSLLSRSCCCVVLRGCVVEIAPPRRG